MTHFKFFVFAIITFVVFIMTQTSVLAATYPVSGVLILLKNITTRQVTASNTDDQGNFNVTVPEANGTYNLFIGDESIPPVKITAKDTAITGRIVVLTDGTTTKEPDPIPPVPVKIAPPIKKSIPKKTSKTAITKAAPIKKPAPKKTLKTVIKKVNSKSVKN